MSGTLDLTPFGFTPTESLLYQVLLTGGPGTGYVIARSAGLARANVYAALENLVAKGAARVEEGRPRRFRPESPSTLLARLSDRQGEALDRLGTALASLSAPTTPTLVELTSNRGALNLMGHEIARASASVLLLAPPEGCLILAPPLRRAVTAGAEVRVLSTASVALGVVAVEVMTPGAWPGDPVLMVVDDRAALIGSRQGDRFTGHWGAGPAFVAAARQVITTLGQR